MLYCTDASSVVVTGPPGAPCEDVANVIAENCSLPVYNAGEGLCDEIEADALCLIISAQPEPGYIVAGPIGYEFVRRVPRVISKKDLPEIIIELEATDAQIKAKCEELGLQYSIAKRKSKLNKTLLKEYLLLDGNLPKIWINATSKSLGQLIGGGPSGTSNNDSST